MNVNKNNYLLSPRPAGEILCSDSSRSLPPVEMTGLYYMGFEFALTCMDALMSRAHGAQELPFAEKNSFFYMSVI